MFPQVWCVSDHVMMCGSEGVRVCGVSGLGGTSLATVLGKATTPPQEAILVTPTWVTPTEVCCHGNIVK